MSKPENEPANKNKNKFLGNFIESLTLEQISLLVQIEDGKLSEHFKNVDFSDEPLLEKFFLGLAPRQILMLMESQAVDKYTPSRNCMNAIMIELFYFRNALTIW